MMRLAVDATAVEPAAKGIGRVAKGVTEALAAAGADVTALVRPGVALAAPSAAVRARPALYWEQVGLARAVRRFDAVLTFTERLPVAPGGRFVVWLYELPARRIEQNRGAGAYQRGSDAVTRVLWSRSLRRAWRVLAGSEATAHELRAALPGLDVRVVYPGLDPRFSPGSRHGGERYVLHLGSTDPRDNTETVLRAFALARARLREPARLLVAGGASGPVAQAVEFRGRVSDDELVGLYRGAAVYIDATLYEGFGYQPLEAMACGAPVVASSSTTSTPEVVGDAAVLADPRDAAALADALVRVLEEPGLADVLCRRGVERAAQFTWRRTVDALLDAIGDA
jgi:glycosyltransferase involved in cell wall biosynthesis